jgi:hypothetical protein
LPAPDASKTVAPLFSSNEYAATRPGIAPAAVGVAAAVAVGDAASGGVAVEVAWGKVGVGLAVLTGVAGSDDGVAVAASVVGVGSLWKTASSFDRSLSIPDATQLLIANEWLTPIARPVTTYSTMPCALASRPTRSLPAANGAFPCRR